MTVAYAEKYDADFLANNMVNKQYFIVYERSSFDRNDRRIIPVKSRREVELLLLILGEEASVIMDEHALKLCGIWDWLSGPDLFQDLC